MKTNNSLPKLPVTLAGVLLIVVWAFTSFITYAPKENLANEIHKLTVQSDDEVQALPFQLLIIGKSADGEIFIKKEKAMTTPYAFDLPKGEYTIVIHRASKKGNVIGKVEKQIDGKPSDSASADFPITVLTINPAGDYTASGL